MRISIKILVASVLVLGACGFRAKGVAQPKGVEDAALPYRVVDARTGSEVSEQQFLDRLNQADGVCIGEDHTNPHHHWVQLHIVDAMSRSGGELALGMEMFQRPFQGVLADFKAGRIDERQLLSRAGYKKRWGYDFSLYRPIIAIAVERDMDLLALNIETELRKRTSKLGIAGLLPSDRAKLPDLVLDDAAHRAWFDGVMADHAEAVSKVGKEGAKHGEKDGAKHGEKHGDKHKADSPHADSPHDKGDGPHSAQPPEEPAAPPVADDSHGDRKPMSSAAVDGSAADRTYAIQVLWDESMADGAATWLGEKVGRRVVILAGSGHCHDTAIVNRLKRRGAKQVLSVLPVIDDGEGNVADALAEPKNDYLFVMSYGK